VQGFGAEQAANNLVVLDGTGKLRLGWCSVVYAPFDIAGTGSYGLSVVNSNAAASAQG